MLAHRAKCPAPQHVRRSRLRRLHSCWSATVRVRLYDIIGPGFRCAAGAVRNPSPTSRTPPQRRRAAR